MGARASGPRLFAGFGGETALDLAGFIEKALARERPLRLIRVQGSAGACLAGRLRQVHPGPMLVVSPTGARAERFASDLVAFTGAEVALLPRYDTPPVDRFSPHPEIEARRMRQLYRQLTADDDTPLT